MQVPAVSVPPKISCCYSSSLQTASWSLDRHPHSDTSKESCILGAAGRCSRDPFGGCHALDAARVTLEGVFPRETRTRNLLLNIESSKQGPQIVPHISIHLFSALGSKMDCKAGLPGNRTNTGRGPPSSRTCHQKPPPWRPRVLIHSTGPGYAATRSPRPLSERRNPASEPPLSLETQRAPVDGVVLQGAVDC